MAEELIGKPALLLGFLAVLVRFVVTSLTSVMAQWLLGRLPFTPSNLAFLPDADYYRAEIYSLPLFGLGIWLLREAAPILC